MTRAKQSWDDYLAKKKKKKVLGYILKSWRYLRGIRGSMNEKQSPLSLFTPFNEMK